jgi:hypothetical protein
MQYLLLIYNEEANDVPFDSPDFQEVMAGYMAFGEEMTKNGSMLGGNALQPVATATTVRVRGDQIQSTDGPFAETKEQLGGYYLLECNDLDEALAAAAKIPGAKTGCVEVRPVQTFD